MEIKLPLINYKMTWEDFVLLFIFLVYLALQTGVVGSFQQLPSPLYGGDYYHQLGAVNHIMSGGPFQVSSLILNSEPIYLPLYGILVAGFASITSMSAMGGMLSFSYIILALSMLFTYIFLKRLFREKYLAVIGTLLYCNLSAFPVLKYSPFTRYVMMPLFLLSILLLVEEKTWKRAVFCGVVYGLIGFSHTVLFAGATFFLLFFFLYELILRYVSFKKKELSFNIGAFKKTFFKNMSIFLVIAIIGFLLAQVYWFKPLFVYHGQTALNYIEFNGLNFFNPSTYLWFLGDSTLSFFLNFSSPLASITTLLTLLGLFFFFILKGRDSPKLKFMLIALIAVLISVYHYTVTAPLLHTFFSPHIMWAHMFPIVTTIFSVFAITILVQHFKKYKVRLVPLLIIVFFVLQVTTATAYWSSDRWIQVGAQPMSPDMLALEEQIKAETDVNDVFLSNNELSFAFNALTGRKVVVSRRAHSSPFLDMDPRTKAAAAILYGSDDTKREELLREYEVKYLFWNPYWINSEYQFDENGNLVNTFDPMLIRDTAENRGYLTALNISYFPQHTWIDPAIKGERIEQFDLLFILPSQFDITHPWSNELDKYLDPFLEYESNGQVVSRVYKIKGI